MLSVLPSPNLPAGAATALSATAGRKPKRLAMKMEESDDTNLSISNKRPKLEPGPTVGSMADDVRNGFARRNPSVISAEIRHAINNHKNGLDQEYDEIIEVFETLPTTTDDPKLPLICQHLYGLASSANLLDSRCSELVHSILSYRWLSSNDNVLVNVYLHFLKNLASLQSGYTSAVLEMLVKNFAQLSSSTDPSGITRMRRLELQARIHLALEQLLQQIPTAIVPLINTLRSNFPHPAQSIKTHVEYVRNMLRLTEYAPALESDILDLIIDRLVSIDVKVQVDVEELDYDIEDDTKSIQQFPANTAGEDWNGADSFSYDSDSGSEESDEEEDPDPEELRSREIRASIKIVDALMDLLFAFLTPKFTRSEDTKQMDSAFSLLTSQFNKTVLPTYRSRHTQFLVFHFAQTSSGHVVRFVDACATILKQKSAPSVFRMSAAAYIGSFTARATHLAHSDVTYIFDTLADYLTHLQRELEPTISVSSRTGGPSLHKHPSYYSTFQALLYIFCFRWRDLLADPKGYVEDDGDLFDGTELTWATGIRELFQSNIFCKLNPLKICAPEIVEEFARIAHHIRFMYVYQVLDSNKRLRLTDPSVSLATRETSLSGLHGDRPHQLDAYFPFDPYRLSISRRWLTGDYNEWKGVPGLHGKDDDEDGETSVSND